jgi:hypothetical protein
MMKTTLIVTTLLLAATSAAHAGGSPGSVGVGAEYQLSGIGGISVNYDAGKFHVGGALGYNDPAGGNNTEVDLIGRFFFHVHSTAMADFSVGGSIGLQSDIETPPAGGSRKSNVYVEPGFQIRVFLASNVALSFTGGISIGVVDADSVALTGQGLNGTAGVHYYFF